ncbi:hypothetical protein I317_02142 [Kwoniella heveanensis CBS 569]|nr:hypothetical protein I317_02142 [Kwoniella heveanensis CBS 569]
MLRSASPSRSSPSASPSTPPRPSQPLPAPITASSSNQSSSPSSSPLHLTVNQTLQQNQTLTPDSVSSCTTEEEDVRSAYIAERSDPEVVNVTDIAITPRKLEDTMTGSGAGVRGKVISPPLSPEKASALRQQQATSPTTASLPKADFRNPSKRSPGAVSVSKTTDRNVFSREHVLAARSTPVSSSALIQEEASSSPRSPIRPPRPAVSPLDLADSDEVEKLQAHPLSAFKTSPAAPHRQPDSPYHRNGHHSSPQAPDLSAKAIQDSFLQWSETASSVDQSESTPPPPSTYASSVSQPADPDRSFLRMTRTTIFSDFSAPSTVPDVPDPSALPTPFKRPITNNGGTLLSVIPETRVIEEQEIVTSPVLRDRKQSSSDDLGTSPDGASVERRSSAGTFGPSHARQSGLGSVSSRSGDTDKYPHRFNNPFASPRSEISMTRAGGKLRPLSMSSAGGESAHTGSAYSGRALDDTAIAARKAVGVFPSKGIHRNPETADIIEDYLKKQSEANMRRIVPSDKPSPRLGSAIELNGVQGSTGGKVGRVLGDGAENARTLLELDRRMDQVTATAVTGLPPPLRSHKASASVPALATPTSPTSPPNHYFTNHTQTHGYPYGHVQSHGHFRSASIDSLPSLHPSLSESINTLSNLIPVSPTKADPRATTANLKTLSPEADLKARNDLTPEQRAILLRRTRKLEQMLGEALPERQIGRLVVDPHHNTSAGWPLTPSRHFSQRRSPGSGISGYNGSSEEDGSPPLLGRERSKTSLADKARAALGFDRQVRRNEEGGLPGVSRTTPSPPDIFAPERVTGSAPETPATFVSTSTTSGGWADEEADESVRRNRRQQLAKLHRLLGAPIPPELLNPCVPPSPAPMAT